MFAVPGWSLSSSLLKTQTTEPVAAPSQKEDQDASGASKETKSSKKRKRAKNPDVNPANLADLWESVIEGKPQPKKQKSSERKHDEKKGTKVKSADAGEDATEDAEEAVNITKDSEELPSSKKEKKDKKDKKDKKKKKNKDSTSTEDGAPASIPDDGPKKSQSENIQQQRQQAPPAPPKPAPKLTPLQASMRQKLISARFRHLNQSLYTTPSADSLILFEQNPEMFQEYHEGFRRQVEVWPENPVDGYLDQIRSRGKQRGPQRGGKPQQEAPSSSPVPPLPRTSGTCHIADLGCGDASLAQGLQKDLKKLKLAIHSFDLHSPSPLVTRADIAALPLADSSVDVAVFCLALMGTNWIDFVEEAFRILRWKGELWVAEIKSRFGRVGHTNKNKRVVEHSVGHRRKNDQKPGNPKAGKAAEEKADEEDLMVLVDGQDAKQETDVGAFVEVLRKRGFVLREEGGVDLRNRMFVKMQFVKGAMPVRGKGVVVKEKEGEGQGQGQEKGGETWKRKKAKFLDEENAEGESVEEEGKVLKPCVYKLR